MSTKNDCEDQGSSRISDGCQRCNTGFVDGKPMHPPFIVTTVSLVTGDRKYYQCPMCKGFYGEVPGSVAAFSVEFDCLVGQIAPLLAGKDPALQGAVLAHLAGIWISGHPRAAWNRLVDMQSSAMRSFAAVQERLKGH